MESCDGALLITAEPYEAEAVAAVKNWYAETGRPAYVCGPLLPPTSATSTAKEKQQSTEAVQIQEFLDTTLKTSGEKSLLYVCLGLNTISVQKRLTVRTCRSLSALFSGRSRRQSRSGRSWTS